MPSMTRSTFRGPAPRPRGPLSAAPQELILLVRRCRSDLADRASIGSRRSRSPLAERALVCRAGYDYLTMGG